MGQVYWSDTKAIAQGEIGYHEEGNNWTKYAKDLDAISYFNGAKQNIAWCCTFTSWCIWKASDPDPKGTALAAQYQPTRDNCGCGVKYNAGYYKNKGKFFSTPEEGDVFFTKGYGHTGFVLKVNGDGTFTTIEGNHNDAVGSTTRKVSDMEGFGRPWYTSESNKPGASAPSTPAKSNAEKAIDEIKGVLKKYGF